MEAEPVPKPGDIEIVLDYRNEPRVIALGREPRDDMLVVCTVFEVLKVLPAVENSCVQLRRRGWNGVRAHGVGNWLRLSFRVEEDFTDRQ